MNIFTVTLLHKIFFMIKTLFQDTSAQSLALQHKSALPLRSNIDADSVFGKVGIIVFTCMWASSICCWYIFYRVSQIVIKALILYNNNICLILL